VPNQSNNKKQSLLSQKDVNLIFRIARANWWVPLLIIPLFYGFGKFYAYKKTNVYIARTQFLLKTNDTYYQNNVLNESSFYSYNSYVDNLNEKRIVESYDIASKVVDKLLDKINVSYFIIGKVVTTEYFRDMPFKIIADETIINEINPGVYEQLYDFKITGSDDFEVSYEVDGQKITRKGKFGVDLPYTDLPFRIEKSFGKKDEAKLRAAVYQFRIHSRKNILAELQGHLVAENLSYTNILEVKLTDIIAERAVLILDTLNSVYSINQLKIKFELNERTIEYIERQLNEITYSLKNFEDTMQNYKSKKNIIDLDWEKGDFLSKIGNYDNEKSQLQLQLSSLDDLEKYVVEDKDPQFLPPNVFVVEKAGFMIVAVNELYTKQIELNKMYGVAKENNPTVIELKSSIKKIKQDLLVYINNTRSATKEKILSVNEEILKYISEAKLIPGKQRDLLNIQRKANVNEQLYNFLLEKKASTKIARAGIISDIKIVESPRNLGTTTPEETEKTRKQLLYLGILITLGIVFTRALFLTNIESVEHLKDLTSIPLIGVLPYMKQGTTDGIVVEESPTSLMAEAFRNFRTNLAYSNIDTNSKVFLVTSFLPAEGKTFTSVNLAAILARSGKKTVLLELDLHKPRIYKRFNLPIQDKGITTYITGQHKIEEIISPTFIPNLYCMFAGPIPPNPSEFVLSEKMKELINYAKDNFEFVIIDTPPAGLLSDSVYLMQNVDSSIFVINTRTSSRKVINFLEELIVANNFKNISLLLNGVKKMGNRYYYKGYGYSYGYGYGYGYGKGYGYGRSGYGSKAGFGTRK
jgi:capsular exopolysaccharide synthesis family protein